MHIFFDIFILKVLKVGIEGAAYKSLGFIMAFLQSVYVRKRDISISEVVYFA